MTVVLLIASYLILVFLLPLMISGVATCRSMPRSRVCPICGRETVALVGPAPALLRRRVRHVHRRWCPACRWEGWARPRTQAAPSPDASPDPAFSLDVRTLRVDGRTWRVQLQWWPGSRTCQGRLAFIAPSGRLLRDGVQCFRGTTQFEVLGQALSIPDPMLVSRIRQLLTSSDR